MAKITVGRQLSELTDAVQSFEQHQLVPEVYDYIAVGYTGDNITSVVYRTGGAGGTVVATLTLAYSGSNLTSITRT
jgi:hypothetical protein